MILSETSLLMPPQHCQVQPCHPWPKQPIAISPMATPYLLLLTLTSLIVNLENSLYDPHNQEVSIGDGKVKNLNIKEENEGVRKVGVGDSVCVFQRCTALSSGAPRNHCSGLISHTAGGHLPPGIRYTPTHPSHTHTHTLTHSHTH